MCASRGIAQSRLRSTAREVLLLLIALAIIEISFRVISIPAKLVVALYGHGDLIKGVVFLISVGLSAAFVQLTRSREALILLGKIDLANLPLFFIIGLGTIATGATIEYLIGAYRVVPLVIHGEIVNLAAVDAINVCREELLYRYIIFTGLAGITGSTRAALLIQALIFSALHVSTPFSFIFAGGALLGVIAIVTKSVWPAAATHLGLNVALSFAYGQGTMGTAGILVPTWIGLSSYPEHNVTCLVMLIVMVGFLELGGGRMRLLLAQKLHQFADLLRR